MRITFSSAIGTLVVVLVGVVLVWGGELIGGPSALGLPDASAQAHPSQVEVLLVATDQAVTMLTTMALGLVVMVGFCLRFAEDEHNSITFGDRLAAAGFIVALFACIFYGFASRRLAFELTNSSYADWRSVQSNINGQAFLLGVDAIFGFYLAARSLERKRVSPATAGGEAAGPKSLAATATTVDATSKFSMADPSGATERPAARSAKPRRRGGR